MTDINANSVTVREKIVIQDKDGGFKGSWHGSAMVFGHSASPAVLAIGNTAKATNEYDIIPDGLLYNGSESKLIMSDDQGREVFHFNAVGSDLYIGGNGNPNGGDLIVRDASTNNRVWVSGGGGYIVLHDNKNQNHAHFGEWNGLSILALGGGGRLPGYFTVRGANGQDRIVLDARDGDIKLVGADCAEQFDLQGPDAEAGTVMVIASEGGLAPCEEAYDRRVAGVVSGAGGTFPGITLGHHQPRGTPRGPIALSGKVFCKVDASCTPIETGDLLTTAETTGHAMKADDPTRAFGAVIGKALRPLQRGVDLIPVLVALQ